MVLFIIFAKCLNSKKNVVNIVRKTTATIILTSFQLCTARYLYLEFIALNSMIKLFSLNNLHKSLWPSLHNTKIIIRITRKKSHEKINATFRNELNFGCVIPNYVIQKVAQHHSSLYHGYTCALSTGLILLSKI